VSDTAGRPQTGAPTNPAPEGSRIGLGIGQPQTAAKPQQAPQQPVGGLASAPPPPPPPPASKSGSAEADPEPNAPGGAGDLVIRVAPDGKAEVVIAPR
jgi:hypothetical protein